MNVTIEQRGGGRQSLSEFADRHGLELVVRERQVDGKVIMKDSRYMAYFMHVEVGEAGMLVGTCGNGPTPEAAIADYASQIQSKNLVFKAMDKNLRREIEVPNELYHDPKEGTE